MIRNKAFLVTDILEQNREKTQHHPTRMDVDGNTSFPSPPQGCIMSESTSSESLSTASSSCTITSIVPISTVMNASAIDDRSPSNRTQLSPRNFQTHQPVSPPTKSQPAKLPVTSMQALQRPTLLMTNPPATMPLPPVTSASPVKQADASGDPAPPWWDQQKPLLLTANVATVPSLSSCPGLLPMVRHPNDRNPATNKNTTVPEFLYQLVKMLAEDNKEVIEWSNAKIMVHNPTKLASDVLGKYFRHSKYSSFQRQLNYFGFRKMAGKGKMAPCSYVNDEVTLDMRSLLSIKRKPHGVNGRGKSNAGSKQKGAKSSQQQSIGTAGSDQAASVDASTKPAAKGPLGDNDAGNGDLSTTASEGGTAPVVLSADNAGPDGSAQSALARGVAGRGVKHHLNGYLRPSPSLSTVDAEQQNNLMELEKNFYKSSMEADKKTTDVDEKQEAEADGAVTFSNGVRVESMTSLVDLAMIPTGPLPPSAEPVSVKEMTGTSDALSFVDFPQGDWNLCSWNDQPDDT